MRWDDRSGAASYQHLVKTLVFAALIACTIAGVTASATAATPNFDQYVLDIPSAAGARASSVRINAASHYPGTPGDHDLALWMRDRLADDGFTATIEPFTAPVPQFKHVTLETYEGKWTAVDLKEPPIAQDPDGSRKDAGIPFNAGSGNGTVTASVVDAGHGLDADYRELSNRHVDIRTRIALIRYGKEFRGSLARRAQRYGAAGAIFFSDPSDRDGSRLGPAYPDGPYRPLGAVQRGSLGAPPVTIPTLPVTALVANRLLQAMDGRVTPQPVRLHVDVPIARATLWNTVGVIPGSDPTHVVVIGGHRDAWVYGVTDNGSGISSILETAHALGYLYKSGWRPRFSIVLAGFDGEEIGEVGSQAYVHMHEAELRAGCVAYINSDESTTGQTFGASAAAALENLVTATTWRVNDPRNERQSLYTRWKAQRGGIALDSPGGGSDFESFIYELGIPTVDVGFGGVFGVYHTSYDDLRYAETQADPGFVNHRAVAQLMGLLAMRLSDGTLAYDLSAYVPHMRRSIDALVASGVPARDLGPVRAAIDRFANRSQYSRNHGWRNADVFQLTRRLNLLFYGRNGYAELDFPDIATAVAEKDNAALSAAVGRAVRELDAIGSAMSSR